MRKLSSLALIVIIISGFILSGCNSNNQKNIEYEKQYRLTKGEYLSATTFVEKSEDNLKVLEYADIVMISHGITKMGDFLLIEKPSENDKNIHYMVSEIMLYKDILTKFLKNLRKLDDLSSHITIDRVAVLNNLTEQEQKEIDYSIDLIRQFRLKIINSIKKENG